MIAQECYLPDYHSLAGEIKSCALDLGFAQCGITGVDLGEHETRLLNWLDKGFHGEMEYMHRHGTRRSRPAELEPGTLRVISVRMDYLPEHMSDAKAVLQDPDAAYVSRYALGRDYHKLMRKRLQSLANQITELIGDFQYRVFVDSAPVLEKALAENAGLGWIGKHSNLLNRKAGSWFFLGELYTNLPLPLDTPAFENHCGSCTACIDACPTGAIVAPYQVDARRCISYLTIELRNSIPVEFRKAMGNRIYGCDDCQLVCPWNRFATETQEPDFSPRHSLDSTTLVELFCWSAEEFESRHAGSAIRRIGYECWIRNIAVALGNAPRSDELIQVLQEKLGTVSPMVDEHIEWALAQHGCA
ncbi:MAG: tRNA epoxyqueuosine(34) reductase QueG [Pseudomonadota bacterium]